MVGAEWQESATADLAVVTATKVRLRGTGNGLRAEAFKPHAHRDQVMVEERAASFAKRSIKAAAKSETGYHIYHIASH